MKCIQLIKSGEEAVGGSAASVPQSPVGVLDAACWSHKSDDLTVGSCANSSHNTPDGKRRRRQESSDDGGGGGGSF